MIHWLSNFGDTAFLCGAPVDWNYSLIFEFLKLFSFDPGIALSHQFFAFPHGLFLTQYLRRLSSCLESVVELISV